MCTYEYVKFIAENHVMLKKVFELVENCNVDKLILIAHIVTHPYTIGEYQQFIQIGVIQISVDH